MIPFRFGSAGDARFGVLHPASEGARMRGAVLLCNPFGQEAIRTHRLFKVLAERFARAGWTTMRFDYLCTGDSDGDDESVSLAGWVADVQLADRILRDRTGATTVAWMGLRLGATAAALASEHAGTPPDRLLLWDPVIEGRGWLEELAAAHVRALRLAFPATRQDLVSRGIEADEAMGFPLTEAFRREVLDLSPARFEVVRCRRLAWLVVEAPEVPGCVGSARPGVASASVRTVGATDWNTDEAMNAAIVPAEVVAAALGELEAA
jgi:pimeloyl-ACP methyl ester carboxylesterase